MQSSGWVGENVVKFLYLALNTDQVDEGLKFFGLQILALQFVPHPYSTPNIEYLSTPNPDAHLKFKILMPFIPPYPLNWNSSWMQNLDIMENSPCIIRSQYCS